MYSALCSRTGGCGVELEWKPVVKKNHHRNNLSFIYSIWLGYDFKLAILGILAATDINESQE